MEDVKTHMASGNITAQDMAWYEGMSEWKPLETVLAEAPASPAEAMPVAATAENKEGEEGSWGGIGWIDVVGWVLLLIGIKLVLRKGLFGDIGLGLCIVAGGVLLVRKAIRLVKEKKKKSGS